MNDTFALNRCTCKAEQNKSDPRANALGVPCFTRYSFRFLAQVSENV